jgi:ribonuclease P protein component
LGTSTRLRFRPEQRLRQPAQFKQVYAARKRFSGRHFTISVLANDELVAAAGPRLGLSMAAKTVGNAVQRNRLKRLVRESFRQQQCALPRLDLVVGARTGASAASSAELRASLAELWSNICQAYAH